MTDAGLPTVDLTFASEYRLIADRPTQRHVLVDAASRVAAVIPVALGGAIVTRTDRWAFRIDQHRFGWAVVAGAGDAGAESGRISTGTLPDTYRLSTATGFEAHVTQNPVNGHWTVRSDHHHLLRVSGINAFATGAKRGQINSSGRVGTVTTLDGPPEPLPLGLLIALTLEMIKAIAAIPSVGGGQIF